MSIYQHARQTLRGLLLAAGAAATLGISAATAAEETDACGDDLPLSGTIAGSGQTVGFLIGARWGKGVLKLDDGREFPFSVRGIKTIETGATLVDWEGEVYNLERVEDFIGHYYGYSTRLVALQGEGQLVMNNSRCVVVVARPVSQGVALSAPTPQGVTVQFSE